MLCAGLRASGASLLIFRCGRYTGELCAQHITTHLPTDLKWAVAGRNSAKLISLIDRLQVLNRDRLQPDVLAVQLNKVELDGVAKKTRVLLNTVGPYHLYSTPVVEACAGNGTHYLDVYGVLLAVLVNVVADYHRTGEVPWVREIIQKVDGMAKSNKAILIPEIGIEAAPSDLVAYTAVSKIRDAYHCGTRDVVCSVHELKAAGPSGGTLATVMGLFDSYSTSDIRASLNPYVLSPRQPPKRSSSDHGFLSRILGVFSYPELGILTTSMTAAANVPVVHRSSGLMPQFYGINFRYTESMRVSNYAWGVAVHLGLMIATLLLTIRPFRTMIKKFIYQPGQGPAAQVTANDILEYRAVGVADQQGPEKKAMVTFRYEGGLYFLTGIFLAEAAMVLLKEKTLVEQLGGGVLTPACLGEAFVERLQNANVHVSGKLL